MGRSGRSTRSGFVWWRDWVVGYWAVSWFRWMRWVFGVLWVFVRHGTSLQQKAASTEIEAALPGPPAKLDGCVLRDATPADSILTFNSVTEQLEGYAVYCLYDSGVFSLARSDLRRTFLRPEFGG